MRTFTGSLAIAALALVAACGSSSSSNTPSTGRSPSTGGQCPAGSTSGQTCTGEAAFNSCIMTACGAQYQACFGSNYASGNFAGSACADFLTCEIQCPCDATAKTCEYTCYTQHAAVGSACSNALLALGVCAAANTAPTGACVSPVCTGGTPPDTSTSTTTSTTTGPNCAAVAACCARMTNATMQSACLQSIPNMKNDEVTCGLALSPLQTYCP
jgi:hypothetical protein